MKKGFFSKLFFGSMVILFSVGALHAKKPVVPTAEEAKKHNVTVVTAQEAKSLADKGAIICDTRKKLEYAKERIKNAVSTLYKEKGGNKNRLANWDKTGEKFNIDAIKDKKDKDLVFYCNGERCWRSYKASVVAAEMGYKSYWLRGGIPAWKQAGYSVE